MTKAEDNRIAIETIKSLYNRGLIDRDTAKILCQPFIDRINEDMLAIAKKYKKTPHKVDFINLMR